MSNPATHILLIHDGIAPSDPLIIYLGEEFGDENIHLREKPHQGLEFVLSNLGNKLIVLLDLDLGAGEPSGIELLEKIREHTSLVHVIIITAKQISSIPNSELVTLINNDALAVLSSTDDMSVILNMVKKASHKLETRVDCVLEQWLMNRPDSIKGAPYLSSGGKTYSLSDLVVEIRKETPIGNNIERMVIQSAIEMFTATNRA